MLFNFCTATLASENQLISAIETHKNAVTLFFNPENNINCIINTSVKALQDYLLEELQVKSDIDDGEYLNSESHQKKFHNFSSFHKEKKHSHITLTVPLEAKLMEALLLAISEYQSHPVREVYEADCIKTMGNSNLDNTVKRPFITKDNLYKAIHKIRDPQFKPGTPFLSYNFYSDRQYQPNLPASTEICSDLSLPAPPRSIIPALDPVFLTIATATLSLAILIGITIARRFNRVGRKTEDKQISHAYPRKRR